LFLFYIHIYFFFTAIGLDVVSAESLFGFESEHERPDLSTSALTEEKLNLPDSSILQPAIQVCTYIYFILLCINHF